MLLLVSLRYVNYFALIRLGEDRIVVAPLVGRETATIVAEKMMPNAPLLVTLVSFNGSNGSNPYGGVIEDAAGNLFGTTTSGPGDGYGTVFEIAKTVSGWASTPTVLTSFTYYKNAYFNGLPSNDPPIQNQGEVAYPYAGVIEDADGNLISTSTNTLAGGPFGMVFEIAKTAGGYDSTPISLYSFGGGSDGNTPQAGLIQDAAGNLFGTTQYGGASNQGVVFEIAKNGASYASAPTVLVTFNGSNGAYPLAGLIEDAAGNLFGTTSGGGAQGKGTVFEIKKTDTGYDSAPTVLATFDGSHGAGPRAGLIEDSAGNLFGTTLVGGAHGVGTVFEIEKTDTGYASTPTVLWSFTGGNDGGHPYGGLIEDAIGDLFGTASDDIVTGGGAVFEIAKTGGTYASAPTVLHHFTGGSDGANPLAGLIADTAGNLFGTASWGADGNSGTVFEITDSGFQVACFTTGTRIATMRGEIDVQDLQAGDLLRTAEGAWAPLRWLGRSPISRRFGDPLRVWPIRIRAGALGGGLPVRDLVVSPRHAVFVDGLLVEAGAMVNGGTIVRVHDMQDAFDYWHVELDTHRLILAESMPTESFLSVAEAMPFANWSEREAPSNAHELPYPRVQSFRQMPRRLRVALGCMLAA